MTTADITTLSQSGTHFGYARTRRHPTVVPFLFTTKDKIDIFDLSQTSDKLDVAKAFVSSLAQAGRHILFVGGKHEVVEIIKSGASRVSEPYCAGRWIGGTLTNFKNIRQRIDRLERLIDYRDSGEMEKKYTKKEQLLLSREIEGLEFRFGGIRNMTELPSALFIVDPRHEKTAVQEANQLNIPIIALASSDCDFSKIQYVIPGNDTSIKSVGMIVDEICDSVSAGRRSAPARA